ncbi:MAG: hypothetical protein ABIP48_11350 [Planctomycetota bacterium]
MFRKRLLPLVLLGFVLAVGCPQSSQQRSIDTPGAGEIVPAEELKVQLGSLAESGEMFPGSETIADNIAAVKAADAEKGAALEKDFADLNGSLGNPDAVKAKAKAMLEKL